MKTRAKIPRESSETARASHRFFGKGGEGGFFSAAPTPKTSNTIDSSGGGMSVQAKLEVNAPGDPFEREADSIAERIVSPSHGGSVAPDGARRTKGAPARIQREENDQTGDVLVEGAETAYEQLKLQPGFESWKERQTQALKFKLWDSQSAEYKAGIVGFGLTNLGLLGTAFAMDPSFRSETIDFLQDKNLALPLGLLPYSEFFPVSSFKYKLPTASFAPYTFETEFEFDAWLKLMREKWGGPKIGLSIGVDSAYGKEGGFDPVTGGNIKMKLGGGIINLSAFYNQTLPPTPMLISNPGAGEPPIWIMRSLPGQLSKNLPTGHGVFLTVDVMRLPELWNPKSERPSSSLRFRKEVSVHRKEASAVEPEKVDGNGNGSVDRVLSSNQGRPLENKTRHMMEDRFGQDLSHVRVHTGREAADSARSINARAYTSGNQIVFGHNQYQPSTRSGQRLLAHELVHVGQQSSVARRKETESSPSLAETLKEMLSEGRYPSAYVALQDHFDWTRDVEKRRWLSQNPEVRYLFLRNLPATLAAGTYSAEELIQLHHRKAFAIIDCWYQTEEDKQSLYAVYPRLFDHLVRYISPYRGSAILDVVKRLTATVQSRKAYPSSWNNREFHEIHLLAPTVGRKIEFYKKYEDSGLFEAVKEKFDPFTGIALPTYERLTDTNEIDRKKALEIYRILKSLPEEQRRAFLDTALFAGTLESDKDAEKYYKRKFRKQYKGLPHNWDFAFFPWNWGEAPFADRKTIDHAALMSGMLNYEDKATREFGFDKGIDSSADPNRGKVVKDTDRLLEQMNDDRNFKDKSRLSMLLAIAIRGGLARQVTEKILVPRHNSGAMAPDILAVVENYGFVASDNFRYHADKAVVAVHDRSAIWYLLKRSLFSKTGSVLGEQRATVDLPTLQDTSMFLGSVGGIKFGEGKHRWDDYFNKKWLDRKVGERAGASTLVANVGQTAPGERRGKVFASVRTSHRQMNVFASSLPIEGLNYFSEGALYRSGEGVIQGLDLLLTWKKDPDESDNEVELILDVSNFEINQLQLIAQKSTLAIGHIGIRSLRFKVTHTRFPGLSGLFKGQGARLASVVLMDLLPAVMKLIPYAVMAMTEEFKGVKEHEYKDALGEVAKKDFAGAETEVSFTKLTVRDLYDTTAGFLDDFSIEKRNKEGKRLRQVIRVEENQFWTTDASLHIKRRIRTIDNKILSLKASQIGSDHDKEIFKLEDEKQKLLDIAAEKGVRRENRDAELDRMRQIWSEIRRLTAELDKRFADAIKNNPTFSALPFRVLNAEKAQLMRDLEYLDHGYFEDKKRAKEGSKAVDRFEARRRVQEFEAKYKSFDVEMAFRGISLHGGGYVRDLINESLKAFGFIDPKLEGIENIKISSVTSSYTVSSAGPAKRGDRPGLGIRNLHIPSIKGPAIAYKTSSMRIDAGKPHLQNVYVSVSFDFAESPLDKDPNKLTKLSLSKLYIRKATLNGLTVKMGDAEPLLDFPNEFPVEAWGIRLSNYDPDKGNIDLKIQDIKARGTYRDKNAEEFGEEISFGIDTTTDNATTEGRRPAISVKYEKGEGGGDTIEADLQIAEAWIPALDIQSPAVHITSHPDATAIRISNLEAAVKVTTTKENVEEKKEESTIIEIERIFIKKLTAQGITIRMFETTESGEGEKVRKEKSKVQEVILPTKDEIFVNDLEVKGLRITLTKDKTTFSTLEGDASIKVGESDLGGVRYREKSSRGRILKALSVHSGKFDALTLEALGRNGRVYTPKQFLQFFGRTRLHGADISGSYGDEKISGTIGVKGQKDKKGRNIPITVDYMEEGEGKGFYKIRLPLERVRIPALKIEKGAHTVVIPKAKRPRQSYLKDVDVNLRVYLNENEAGKLLYDVYLDRLEAAEMAVFGLEYHNSEKGIDVIFAPDKPLHIPNVKAGGFRFSSWKSFDAFGTKGGWLEAATGKDEAISARFDAISAALTDGSFLAEKDTASGRSALDVNIASLGFTYDKAGNIKVTLGKVTGGFPKLTISQTDPVKGTKTVTTVSSLGGKSVSAETVGITIGADQNKEIDVQGIEAGGLTITSTETKGSETSTTKVTVAPESVGAKSVLASLKADGSKEIIIKDIVAGRINVDLISAGAKGKSEKYITLPDPKLVDVPEVRVVIDTDANKHITVVKPTIRKFQLRIPSQTVPGDYFSVSCDLAIKGELELGEGNFDKLTFEDPRDAFIALVEEDVPVEITNLSLEYQDTSKEAEDEEGPPKPLTADQQKLLELELEMQKAYEEMMNTPPTIMSRPEPIDNPAYWKAAEKWSAAKDAYEKHKGRMIGKAKREADSSMTKKYLDAISGKVTASMNVFKNTIPVNVESYQGEHYIEISKTVTDELKGVIRSLIASTVDRPFWSSKEMKEIGEGLKRWWLRVFTAPTAKTDVDAIASGNAAGVVSLLLRDLMMWPGILETDASMFGINLNLEGYWALDVTPYDSFGVGLCEKKYRHPHKNDLYSLYGIIEYMKYVSPVLVSASGELDKARLAELKKGVYKSEEEVGEMGISDAVNELILFIRYNLTREAERLKNTVIRNIHGVHIEADVSLRPQEVIDALLKEKKAGTFKFKEKETIEGVHVEGEYTNKGVPRATGTIGGGKKGSEKILIPGATYLSEDLKTKVTYDAVDLTPLSVSYKQNIYQLDGKAITIKGLKMGRKKS